MGTLRERIARELFDIWKEAKETTPEPWDDVRWETLSEKHQGEYLKTASGILAFIRAKVGGIENPYTNLEQGLGWTFEQARQAVLKVLE